MNLPFLHPSLIDAAAKKWRGMFNLNDSSWGRGGSAPPPEASKPDAKPEASKPEASKPEAPKPEVQPPQRPSNNGGGNGSNNGNNGNQPPDLDEIWRDISSKINRIFGNGKSGNQQPNSPKPNNNGQNNGNNNSNGGMPQIPDFKVTPKGVGAIVGIVVVIWLATGFYIVQEGNQAVITQLGKFKGPESGVAGAGVNWRLPYPLESHEIVTVSKTRSIYIGVIKSQQGNSNAAVRDSSMLTQDENIVDVRFEVQFRLKSASDYVFNNVDPDKAVSLAAESAVREVVGKGTMNTVLNEKREAIAGDILKLIQAQLNAYKTGILISSVNIQNVQPPEQVQAAFDDALKAGQDGDRAKNEGQAYANDVIPRAEGAAARLREEAEGYKAKVVAQAEGDASRFKAILPEYQRAPQVMRDRLYTDTMQQIYSNTTKVLVDSKQGSQLLYLPLDKLLQATASSEIVLSPATTPGLNSPASAAPSVGTPASGSGSGASSIPGNTNPRGRERESR
jgi:modulator of FtsH protease HflK